MPLRINDTKIDWTSPDSHYFFNPWHPQARKLKKLTNELPFLKGHIYLFTSHLGNICLLSKSAFLCSAQAVNKNLQTQTTDKWLISLPLFHVAGLSILARRFCGGFSCELSSFSWQASSFQKELEEKKISLCSLVPAQIYDLVQYNLKAPKTLRAALVGGDSLSPWLYKKARSLGWPILTSYGLTEISSQVACADLSSLNKNRFPKMKILDHIEIKKIRSGVKLKSDSLLTAYFDIQKKTLKDPKDSEGWLELPDEILLEKNSLLVKGRKDEEIKVLGERVSLQKLSFLLEELSSNVLGECHLTAVPDSRQGLKLVLVTNCFDFSKILLLVKGFNAKVLPFEKIQNIYYVSEIQKSSLFKVRQKQIQKQLGFYTNRV